MEGIRGSPQLLGERSLGGAEVWGGSCARVTQVQVLCLRAGGKWSRGGRGSVRVGGQQSRYEPVTDPRTHAPHQPPRPGFRHKQAGCLPGAPGNWGLQLFHGQQLLFCTGLVLTHSLCSTSPGSKLALLALSSLLEQCGHAKLPAFNGNSCPNLAVRKEQIGHSLRHHHDEHPQNAR